MTAFASYPSASAHKLLTDNRDLAFIQSAMTRNGVVAPFPAGRSLTHSSHKGRASGFVSTTIPAAMSGEEFGPCWPVMPMTEAEGREYVRQETADGRLLNQPH